MASPLSRRPRIALIEPRLPSSAGMLVHLAYEPYGLLMVGAALRSAGFAVRLWTQGSEETADALARRVAAWAPDALGVSVYAANVTQGRRIAAAMRNVGLQGPVVFGGVHATAAPELALAPEVDYVVRGEGEHTGPALFRALLEGADVGSIPGVAYARDGVLRETAPFTLIEDLGALPWGARDLCAPTWEYSLGAYGRRKAILMTSRGCHHACDFCLAPLLSRRRVRLRDPEDVAAEALALKEKQGVQFIYFGDDDFFAYPDHAAAVCEALIRRRVDLPFFCMGRLERLEEPLLALLARAGCLRFLVGLERPPGPSAWTRKARDEAQVAAALHRARRAGLFVHVGLMIGFPDETVESLAEVRRFVRGVEADYLSLTLFTPFPGTALRGRLEAAGVTCHSDDASYAYDRLAFAHPNLSAEDLLAGRQRIYRAFYLGPRYFGRAAGLALRRPRIGVDFGRLLWRGVRGGLLAG